MKKEDGDKIVLFPNVERRLAEKGIEALRQKNYREAISLLEQGYGLDPDNSDITAGLVLAYFESGALRKSKDLCKKMLLSGMGDYFQLVEMYITILIQLHEYREITEVLEALLDEKEIPAEKKEHFFTILQFCKRLADNEPDRLQELIPETGMDDGYPEQDMHEEIRPGEIDFLGITDMNEQVMIAGKLAAQDIRKLLPEISDFLESDEGHPFLKTMLLNILREQEILVEVAIQKIGLKMKVVPAELPALESMPVNMEIINLLATELEHQDPILLENAVELANRHHFSIYPFQMEPKSPPAWAAAFHLTALTYHGLMADTGKMALLYNVKSKDVERAIMWVQQVEEISYPII